MKKTKIVHLIMSFGAGGAEALVKNLALKLSNESYYEVEVWAIGKSWNNAFEKNYIRELNSFKVKCRNFNKRIGKDYIRTIYKLYKTIKQEKISIINTHSELLTFYVILSTIFHPIKIVQTIHNIKINYPIFQKYIAKYFVDFWVCVANIIKVELLNTVGATETKVSVIYNGIKLYQLDNNKNLSSVGSLICIGRFASQKNHLCLIEAFNFFLKNINNQGGVKPKLLLIGDGPLKNTIVKRVSELQLEELIIFKGIVSNIDDFYRNSDILVLSSDWEGFPMVLLEAVSYGLPVISTNVGGVNEIVKDGVNGLLVESRNPEALAEAIYKLYSDSELRENFYLNNKSIRMIYDINNCSQKYLLLYKNIIKN